MILDPQASPDDLERDGAFFDPRASWTIAFWYLIQTSTPTGGTSRSPFYQGGTAYLYPRSSDNTNTLKWIVSDGTTEYATTAALLALGTRVYVAATYHATTHVISFCINGVVVGTMTHDMSAWDFVTGGTTQYLLSNTWHDHAIERVRIWQRTLTLAELQAEQVTTTAASATNLLADTPLVSPADVTDVSGNGYDFTTVGAGLTGPLVSPTLFAPPTTVAFADHFVERTAAGTVQTGWSSGSATGVTLWGNAASPACGCGVYGTQATKVFATPIAGGSVRLRIAAIIPTFDPVTYAPFGVPIVYVFPAGGPSNRFQALIHLRSDGSFAIRGGLHAGSTVNFATAAGLYPTDGTWFGLQIRIAISGTASTIIFTVNNVDVATVTDTHVFDAPLSWDTLALSGGFTYGSPQTDVLLMDDVEVDASNAAVDWRAGSAITLDLLYTCIGAPPPPVVLHNADLTIGLTWIILTTRTGLQYVWSDRALPDPSTYYLGWKEPRVLAWGKISRALSNVLTGQYENAVFTVDLDDTDRLLRGLDDDRDLIGASVLVHMISDVGRRARLVARTVFRGLITDAQPTATLRYTLTMKDPFAEHVATHTPPPMRVFTTADFPNCALDKVPCSAAAYLVNGAILIGVTVVVVDTGYGIFAPGAVFTFAGHATVYTVSSSTLTDPETSVTFSPALTSNVANNEAITVQASFTVPTAVGQRVQVPYGAITDYHLTSGVDDGDGQGPMVYVGDRVLADGKTYGEFIWSAAACYSPSSKPFQMLYFWNNPLDGAGSVAYGATAVTFSDLTTEAGSGGRIALPGYANWATLGYTHTYIDINGRRYTRLFLRGLFRDWALGILKAPDNLGGVPFAVNAYGCETVGNATGTLITNGLLQYLHVLQNWLPPIGDCYQTGAWKTTPLYPDGWPMIDEASFAAADAQSAVYVSTGFRGDFLLFVHNDQTSARDLVARFNLSFGVQSGWNNNIQFFVSLVNTDLGSTTLADPLGYERDIFAGSFTITGVTRDLYTAITYRHTQEYLGRAPDGWRSVVSGVTEVENTGATSDYGGKTTYQTLFLYMVRGKNRAIDADDYARGTDTAAAVLALTLARVSAIQHLPVLGTGPAGFSYELGDVVPVTHYEGLSTAGWIARPIRIERVEIDPSQFISGLEGYDLDPLL